MKQAPNQPSQQSNTLTRPLTRLQIPQSTRQSLMSMMRQIMQQSYLYSDELHYIAEESVEESIVDNREEVLVMTVEEARDCINHNNDVRGQQIDYSNNQANSNSGPNDFSNLKQITRRCGSYYSTFSRQKSLQLQTIQKTFNDLNTNLNMAFEQIINQLVKKQKQLKQFLLKKYSQIIKIKQLQDTKLTNALRQIQQLNYITQKSAQLSLQLHNYAQTLNEFYSIMQDIQRSNFKQMVEEAVSFISNLVTEQIRVVLCETIPARLRDKQIIRENSREFLVQERDNDNMREGRSDTFGILDLQSFTKLFLQHDQRCDQSVRDKSGGDSQNVAQVKCCQQKNKGEIVDCLVGSMRDVSIQHNPQDGVHKFINSRQSVINDDKLSKQKRFTKNIINKIQTHPATIPSNLSPVKNTNFTLSPVKKTTLIANCSKQNQNELQLIKKISYQQSNRSAKIKGYMVTFQDPKLINQELPHQNKPQPTRINNHSKSPSQLAKTPTKPNKSTQKKVLNSMPINQSMNHSNQPKLKHSLKTSRNSTSVSQFKVITSRRQSLAMNK